MNVQEANKLLAVAKANYSYAFKTMTQSDKKALVYSWAFALQDIPADIVLLAFMQLLSVSKWLPTVAEIRERVKNLHFEAAVGNIDALAEMMGETESLESRKARDYIMQSTYKLRDSAESGPPMLKLDTILRSYNGGRICEGMMRALDNEKTEYLPEGEDGT